MRSRPVRPAGYRHVLRIACSSRGSHGVSALAPLKEDRWRPLAAPIRMSPARRERQAEPPIVAEAVTAGSHDQCVALVPDWGQEVAGGANGHGHQQGIGVQAEPLRRACGDRRHDQRRCCIVEEGGQDHRRHQDERDRTGRWRRSMSRMISTYFSFRLHAAVPAPILDGPKKLWVICVPALILGLGLFPQCI